MYDFTGKVALVTGGASGLGLATATRLARDGAAVAIVDRNEKALAAAKSALEASGAKVRTVVGDVSARADVDAAVTSVEADLGAIDILVNNAGIWVIKAYVDHTEDDFDRQVAVNLKGTHLFMRRILPGMMERGHGAIVNTASIAAMHFTVPHAGYAATKAAVMALTRDVAFEAASHGVRVNCVAPGLIRVEREGGAAHYVMSQAKAAGGQLDDRTANWPLGWGVPEDIANVVAFLVSDDARFVVGHTIPVAGGSDLQVTMAKTS
jgi:NAD(P)-dependent dehydrogenase (short-subunit alcohol dehydrogenase family)